MMMTKEEIEMAKDEIRMTKEEFIDDYLKKQKEYMMYFDVDKWSEEGLIFCELCPFNAECGVGYHCKEAFKELIKEY